MNFEFHNPTRLVFGAGNLTRLGEVVKKKGTRALLVTGGGSIKRSGTFDRAVASLNNAGVVVVDCSGIEPNPRITSVIRGAQIVREQKCDIIVALGGGSVMDASKVIAAAALYDGDPWDMILHGQEQVHIPTQALPVVTVPTLAATGSEMNCGAVITNEETSEKSFVQNPCLYPYAAVVDPELTLTVPKDQTAYGVTDLITHVTEGYFNGIDGTPIQDRFAEGVILTAMEWGPKAIANPGDLEARTQIQWAALVALNGWVQVGTNYTAPVHFIEHTLSAYHDVTHAAGLAVINPSWMRFAAKARPERFAQFAQRIFGLPAGTDTLSCALAGIDKFEGFLVSVGCPTRLSQLGVGDELIPIYAKETIRIINDGRGRLPGRPAMSEQDIIDVLKAAL
ncbi:MAG: iron-containing alcohol dehydrogenase [Desulfobulbus sp.]|nr:iron-containing alcohol dehydrogenase [Desulfobulbus sp.]